MKKKKEKINWLIDVGGYSKTEKKEMTTQPKDLACGLNYEQPQTRVKTDNPTIWTKIGF